MSAGCRVALVLALLAAGCGDDGTMVSLPDARVDAFEGVPDGPVADALEIEGDAAAACAAAAAGLEEDLYADLGGCSTIVRLDLATRAVLSFQHVCGRYADGPVLETLSRTQAQGDTGFGDNGETMLNAADPIDAYVFSDAPGGVAAVSAFTGLTLFGASMEADPGAGDIVYPTEAWQPGDNLAVGCPPAGGIPAAVGYDLETGAALDAGDVDATIDVVADTALPLAYWSNGRIFNAVVLRYPRTVEPVDTTTAEWVVLVNGGDIQN